MIEYVRPIFDATPLEINATVTCYTRCRRLFALPSRQALVVEKVEFALSPHHTTQNDNHLGSRLHILKLSYTTFPCRTLTLRRKM